MANKQLTNLTAGIAISDADLFLTRQGADIEDTKVIASQLQIYAQIGLTIGVDVQAWTAVLEATTASFLITDETKLDGIEAGATIDQTGAEIKTAYEVEANAYTDTKDTKLAGIETAATIDQTGAEIKSAYEAEVNAYTDTKNTKLAGIETAATADAKASETEVFTGTDDTKFVTPLNLKPKETFIVALGDEVTDAIAGEATVTFRMPYAFEISGVRASVTTAPTGSVLTVDINETGTSILSTKLTIDATEKTSTTAATPAVISDSTLADDAEITIDIDAVGSTIAGTGIKIYLIGNRT
ncbi:MAG: hypothetical protein ACUZ8E_17560 [Candidatus Anammoxibacter sp.]